MLTFFLYQVCSFRRVRYSSENVPYAKNEERSQLKFHHLSPPFDLILGLLFMIHPLSTLSQEYGQEVDSKIRVRLKSDLALWLKPNLEYEKQKVLVLETVLRTFY